MIFKILTSPLRHDNLTTQVFLAGTLPIPGIGYYLVSCTRKDLLKL